ncbi:MAG: STAS domain-containing protein [Planctomycetota bacterium]
MTESSFIRSEPAGKAVNVTILSPQIGDREAQIISSEIEQAAGPAGWRIAIDMREVTFLASAGLGILVSAHNAARASKGKLAVYNIAPELLDMLKLTHLDKLFTIKSDQAAALKAVS